MRFFNRVKLQTPESVELEFTLAGIGSRAYALLIDYLVLGIVLIAVTISSIYFYFQLQDTFNDYIQQNITLWIVSIQLLVSFFIYVGYFVFFEVLWQGQTPGKRYVKIRVIQDDGRLVGLQQATLRALLRPVDDLFFLGAFLIVFSKQEKRLGDWLAGTIVIQEEQPVASANFSISAETQALANQLLVEARLGELLPEDFAVVREYLQRRKAMSSKARTQLSQKLADRVKKIIALERMPARVTANQFLEAVYFAYQEQLR